MNETAAPEATAPRTAPHGSAPAPPPFVAQGAGPITPLDWARVSLSVSTLDITQVGVVTRSADGVLSSSVVPLEPSPDKDVVTTPLAMVGGREVPPPNAVRLPARGALAVVLAQPGGQGPSSVLVWQLVTPSSIVRIGARHPVGDDSRDLWIYPPVTAPRGEQHNLGEVSAAPPMWPPGTYRFDLTGPAGATGHLFVIFEPDGPG